MSITVIRKSASELVIARYLLNRRQLSFSRGGRYPLTEDTDLRSVLAEWQAECRDDRIVLALPAGLLAMRELALPFSDRRKAREVLPLELRGELVAEVDELVFEALPLADGKTAAIWCRRSALATEIAAFAASGFDPEVVTFDLFGWRQLLPAAGGVVALTDGEALAVYRDGRPLYFRVLPQSGPGQFAATVAALELAKDVQVDDRFVIGSPATGGSAGEPLPVAGGQAAAFAGDTAAAADLAATYACALELLNGEPVNLRRGDLIFTSGRDRLRRKLRLTWALAALLVLVFFAEAGVKYVLARRDVASVDSSIRLIYREVFPNRAKAVDEVAEIKAEIKRLGATEAGAVLPVLKKLAEVKGDEPRELYEIEIDGGQVTGRGYDRSAQSVNEFKTRAASWFSGFEVSEIKSRPDGSVSFAFRGSFQGGGK